MKNNLKLVLIVGLVILIIVGVTLASKLTSKQENNRNNRINTEAYNNSLYEVKELLNGNLLYKIRNNNSFGIESTMKILTYNDEDVLSGDIKLKYYLLLLIVNVMLILI